MLVHGGFRCGSGCADRARWWINVVAVKAHGSYMLSAGGSRYDPFLAATLTAALAFMLGLTYRTRTPR